MKKRSIYDDEEYIAEEYNFVKYPPPYEDEFEPSYEYGLFPDSLIVVPRIVVFIALLISIPFYL